MYFSAVMAIFNANPAMKEFAHAIATNNPEQHCVYGQLFKPFRITSGRLNLLYRSGCGHS